MRGQAPRDYLGFAGFLVRNKIDSISFNADALLKDIENINKAEEGIKYQNHPIGLFLRYFFSMPDMVTKPLRKNNGYVITSGPSSGKTTIANLPKAKGCKTTNENTRRGNGKITVEIKKINAIKTVSYKKFLCLNIFL